MSVRGDIGEMSVDEYNRQYGTWERMENAYGELEGFICRCGRQSNEASKYCPNCGRKMSGGEKKIR